MQNLLLQLDPTAIQNSLTSTANTLIEQVTPELPHTSFVTDLAFIMIIGAIVTLAFFKIKQPLIIGYLFAGMLIGPLSPLWTWILPESTSSPELLDGVGILSDISALNLFSEIGVILLLFVIGIEFPYAKIKSIGRVAVGVGSIGLFSTLGVLFYTSTALGLEFMDALFISAALSVSSTAIIVKLLEEMGKIKKGSSILILGILIVEDIIAVILISTLQSVALVGTVSVESIVVIVLVAAGLIVGTFTLGTRVIPPLIDRVAAAENREILLLSVLGLCFGYALLANIVGLSVAIGAFLAGVLVAESKSAEVAKNISMQIAAMNPIALNEDGVSQEIIKKEIEIAKDQLRQEGKPEEMLENIAKGKIKKFFKENTLLNQQYIKNSKQSITDYINSEHKGLDVKDFARVSLG